MAFQLPHDCHDKVRVLYVSYGSNLLQKRLNVYIQGGAIEGNCRTFVGATNKEAPRSSQRVGIPFELRFQKEGKNWGKGGVGFLDARSLASDSSKHAIGRAYDISLEQFNDILSQENDHCVSPVPRLSREALESLVASGFGTGIELVPNSWYGYLLFLGREGDCGLPMLTFTCHPREASLPLNPPSPPYFNVIAAGLQELGLERKKALCYLLSRIYEQLEETIDLSDERYRHYLSDA